MRKQSTKGKGSKKGREEGNGERGGRGGRGEKRGESEEEREEGWKDVKSRNSPCLESHRPGWVYTLLLHRIGKRKLIKL